jgi:hypothetical protein
MKDIIKKWEEYKKHVQKKNDKTAKVLSKENTRLYEEWKKDRDLRVKKYEERKEKEERDYEEAMKYYYNLPWYKRMFSEEPRWSDMCMFNPYPSSSMPPYMEIKLDEATTEGFMDYLTQTL